MKKLKEDVLKLKQKNNTCLLRVNMKYIKIKFSPSGKITNPLTRKQKYFVLANMNDEKVYDFEPINGTKLQ